MFVSFLIWRKCYETLSPACPNLASVIWSEKQVLIHTEHVKLFILEDVRAYQMLSYL